ncbi:MAG: protein phosphatase 2C domain-containing protein [Clostridia bacterium]|nr:protein phosphatase 2C domain-containing protein [Clostridia bacterium]
MTENGYLNPFLFALIFFVVIILLFWIRHYLKNLMIKPDVLIGNAQIMGKRKEQEDYFSTVVTEKGVMAVLADGMGGYSNGKMASNVAVNTFIREFSKTRNLCPIEDFFINTSQLSNKKILEKGKGIKTGTTLAVVVILEGQLYWASIGDSAIVLFRNGEIMNLNKKHIFESILEEQYISGEISREEMAGNSKKKRLTSFIGHEGFREIEICKESIALRPGDKIILCSDGVYNSITEIEMERILTKNVEPFNAAEEIIELIDMKDCRNQDNATIVILEKNN